MLLIENLKTTVRSKKVDEVMKLVKLASCAYCGMPIAMVFNTKDRDIPSVSKVVGPCCDKDSKWILVDVLYSYIGGLQYNTVERHRKRLAELQEEAK